MKKTYLLTPGPTPIPEWVLQSQAAPIPHHRTPEFESLFSEVRKSLQCLFHTRQSVLTLAASGTGAMEAAITNLFSPGATVAVLCAGKFGERWTQLSRHFGLQAIEIRPRAPGLPLTPADLDAANLPEGLAGVLFQASETSTGVAMPVQAIAQWCQDRSSRTGQTVLSICDAITACGVIPLPMDDWGLDVLITGSQKALMIPPGLAFIALSDRAWKAQSTATLPRFYFDLARERKLQEKNQTAWTPAIGLIVGLHAAFLEIEKITWPKLFARYALLAAAMRAGVQALGLKLLASESPSTAVTAAWLPESIRQAQQGKAVIQTMRKRYGVVIAGGQDELEGQIVRLSHLGYMGPFDVLTALQALEWAIQDAGVTVQTGTATTAAAQVLGNDRSTAFE